jgi:tellurite resistance protein TerA
MKEFARGQKSKIQDLTTSTDLTVSLDAQASGSPEFDISCFGVDADGKLSDDRYFVFYNQKRSPEGEIEALGAQNGDREAFRVNLSILPQKIQKLVFTITLDGAGTMSQVSRGHLRITTGGSEVARFPFTGADFSQEKAVIVGEIYRKDVWRFAAVGQGFNGGLSALLQHFGGQEIEDTAPAPAAAPPPAPASPAPKVNISKMTLDKKGDKQVVDLKKGGGARPIHINLNWDASAGGGKRGIFGLGGGGAPDLDLGCMYRLKNGDASVIQALGGNFGAKDRSPYIFLDKDDRSGAASDGENLYLHRAAEIDVVMVFAFIE